MPYAPGITYRGGEYLADAISSAGSDLGYGLERRLSRNRADKLLAQEKQEAREKEDKRRAKEWQSYAGIAETSELATKDQLEVMSLEEIKGMVEGTKLKQFFEKSGLDMDLLREQLAGRQQENALAETMAPLKQESSAAQLRKYLDDEGQGTAALGFQELLSQGSGQDLQSLMGAAAQSGYRVSPQDLKALKEMLPAGQFVPQYGTVGPDEIPYVTTGPEQARVLDALIANNPKYAPKAKTTSAGDAARVSKRLGELRKELKDTTLGAGDRAAILDEINGLRSLLGQAGPASPGGQTGGAPAPAGEGAPTAKVVRTKAEFDALPEGAEFTGADGKRYRKQANAKPK
jgi:hypothetical protein